MVERKMTIKRIEARVYEGTDLFLLLEEFDKRTLDAGDKSRMIRKALELWLLLSSLDKTERLKRFKDMKENIFFV